MMTLTESNAWLVLMDVVPALRYDAGKASEQGLEVTADMKHAAADGLRKLLRVVEVFDAVSDQAEVRPALFVNWPDVWLEFDPPEYGEGRSDAPRVRVDVTPGGYALDDRVLSDSLELLAGVEEILEKGVGYE